MDLREITRLHALFAPDTAVIDLPSQIAALPSPASERRASGDIVGKRWREATPLLRRCTIALVAVAVAGSAGVGAAVLYRSFQADMTSAMLTSRKGVQSEAPQTRVALSPSAVTTLREIDAAEPTPTFAAPALTLTGSDLPGTLPGKLTADQFRHNLYDRPALSQSARSASVSEEQLAMISPIKRPSQSLQPATATPPVAAVVEAVPMAASPVAASPAQIAVAQVTQPIAIARVTKAASAAPAPVAASTASTQVVKTAPSLHHRRVKDRQARADESAASPSDSTKTAPSPVKAPGSNEVQMF
jgi:hypothetical protein